jgi:hypothetical protein
LRVSLIKYQYPTADVTIVNNNINIYFLYLRSFVLEIYAQPSPNNNAQMTPTIDAAVTPKYDILNMAIIMAAINAAIGPQSIAAQIIARYLKSAILVAVAWIEYNINIAPNKPKKAPEVVCTCKGSFVAREYFLKICPNKNKKVAMIATLENNSLYIKTSILCNFCNHQEIGCN